MALVAVEMALGNFEQTAALAQRTLTLARSMGSLQRAAASLFFLGEATACLGDPAAAIGWYEQCLPMCRATGDRRKEALTLFGLGRALLSSGDATAACQSHGQAHAIFEQVGPPNWAAENTAHNALCQMRLGHLDAALSSVNQLLDRLHGDLAQEYPDRTISLRWYCHQVLEAAGDQRAPPLLEQLHADVQEQAASLNGDADSVRLIQAIPDFRDIVAAYRRRGGPAAPG